MLTGRQLIFRYSTFAVLATAVNFISQTAVLTLVGSTYGVGISLVAGTLAGFIAKYVLDKKYLFFDELGSVKRETTKMLLYGLTAVITTLAFWSLELGAWGLWHTPMAKYTGGAIGLCIGYFAKYRLDRRFVFCFEP